MSNTSSLESSLNSHNCSENCNAVALNTNSSCPALSVEEMRTIRALNDAIPIHMTTVFSLALVTGLPGSVLALVTFSRMTLRPTTLYMCMLAVSDFLYLSITSPLMYKASERHFTYNGMLLLIAFGRIFQCFSHWTLVLICLERFVSVRFPFKKSEIYTIKNSVLSSCLALVLSTAPFVMVIINMFNESLQLHKIETLVFNLDYIIVPGCLIVILTSVTAFFLRRGLRRRNQITSDASRGSSNTETELTRMMFLTVICFIVFVFPFGGFLIVESTMTRWSLNRFCPLAGTIYSFFVKATNSYSFLNHAVNVYIYLACSRGFRKLSLRLVCCRQRLRGDSSSA
ncbi:rhodopsin [Elysia marginata]|uniref:Rhodopsin n=1 Tax=Elysia marginata TaxID=1093978 RepID=A0AAV4J4V2_9GAST|nr:rhodopsin [Elysia marginata]